MRTRATIQIKEPTIRQLELAATPRPSPDSSPITVSRLDAEKVRVDIHPHVDCLDIAEAAVRLCDDSTLTLWLLSYGVYVPVRAYRINYREIMGSHGLLHPGADVHHHITPEEQRPVQLSPLPGARPAE